MEDDTVVRTRLARDERAEPSERYHSSQTELQLLLAHHHFPCARTGGAQCTVEPLYELASQLATEGIGGDARLKKEIIVISNDHIFCTALLRVTSYRTGLAQIKWRAGSVHKTSVAAIRHKKKGVIEARGAGRPTLCIPQCTSTA